MAKPKFESGASSLQFSVGLVYPLERRLETGQVTDRAASGKLWVENLGYDIETRPIRFDSLPKADYDALVNWFENIAVGATNTFTYYDEEGQGMTVRIVSNVYEFKQVSYHRYSGELVLEVVD